MPERIDLIDVFFRLVTALTEKPATPRQPLTGAWSEAEDREREVRVARAAEEERASREAERLRREARERQSREAAARERHDRSAIGQASDGAWHAYLGTPAARAAYADYGFHVADPPDGGERFAQLERRYPEYGRGGCQRVMSVDRGDRLTASTPDGESGMRGWVTLEWQGAEGQVAPRMDTWMRLRDTEGRLVAVALNRYVGMGRPMEFDGVIDRAGLLNLSRFVNGYGGGWTDLTESGEQVTLLALRPGGLAIYEEARRLFRASWEAAHARHSGSGDRQRHG